MQKNNHSSSAHTKHFASPFVQHAVEYDRHMRDTGHYAAQKKTIRALELEMQGPVLDVACGTGRLLHFLRPDCPQLYANDQSAVMVKLCQKRNPSIPGTNKDAEKEGFYANKKFETIICCNFFYYLKNPTKTLKRWSRLLSRKGRIIIMEESPFVSPPKSKAFSRDIRMVIKPIAIAKITRLVQDCDFRLKEKIRVPIDKKHHLYGLLFEKVAK